MRRSVLVGVTVPAFAICMAASFLVQGCSRPMVFRGKEVKAVEIRYGKG